MMTNLYCKECGCKVTKNAGPGWNCPQCGWLPNQIMVYEK